MSRHLGVVLAMTLAVGAGGCGRQTDQSGATANRQPRRPNILLVVWDTVRADRLSLYGYQRPTTPRLEKLAREAVVFENCVAAGSTTVPSHASMFTGLLPSEHGVSNERPLLAERFVTLAESLRQAGYATYAFSENPHLCRETHMLQGFEVVEHPWSDKYARQALRITLEKRFVGANVDEMMAKMSGTDLKKLQWKIKAAGTLAQRGVLDWLKTQPAERPYFVFINYMEAHRPLTPSRRYRERLMTPEQLRASYQPPRSFVDLWSYVFGLREARPGELELTQARYDACLAELDDLFGNLLDALRSAGRLENTAVILVADHGEHLGEHHLLDHQFSVYEPLMHVPLVIWYPQRLEPRRRSEPVCNVDIYPTVLELAGVEPAVRSSAVSLLAPRAQRDRLGECPEPMYGAFRIVRQQYPDFDPTPWRRSLRAFYSGSFKLIAGSNGHVELYDLSADPGEEHDLSAAQPELLGRMKRRLAALLSKLRPQPERAVRPGRLRDSGVLQRLKQIGYVGGSDDEEEDDTPAGPPTRPAPTSRPTSRPVKAP